MRVSKWLLLVLLALSCTRAAPSADQKAADETRPPPRHTKAVDIHVKRDGYVPSSIQVKANEPITLLFTRVEDTMCGAEVAIPSLGIKKALPLNEVVPIEIRPEKEGEVTFTCGMNMMRGTLLVKN